MVSKWGWQLLKLSRKLWVRTVSFAVLALISAMVAIAVQPFIPESLSDIIGAGAAEKILTILASSMLTVTTFSLSVMIAAFSASTNSVSPRATRLLMEDTTGKGHKTRNLKPATRSSAATSTTRPPSTTAKCSPTPSAWRWA